MKTRVWFLLLVTALTVCTALSFAQEQAPAPVFKDGDTWKFNRIVKGRASSSERFTGTYDLVFSQGQIKVYEINDDKRTEMDVKSEGPGSGLLSLIGIVEERPILKFPLSVGQKWNYEFLNRPAGAREESKYFVEIAVTGIEEVTTRAGSFKAFKLIRNQQRRAAGRQVRWISTTTTYFYSSETKSIVKLISVSDEGSASQETELLKYTPGN